MSPLRRLATLALAVTMAACSVGDSIGPDGSIDARFTLRTLNGFSLPYTFSNGLTLVSEELNMYRNGTYTVRSRYGDGSTGGEEGIYSNTNGSIYFEPRTGVAYQGSLTGDTLTEIVGGFTQVYRRE
jgi:hypothetical protein